MMPFFILALMGVRSAADIITLSGTVSVPNVATDTTISPANAQSGFRFNIDGTIDENNGGIYTQFQAGVEWDDISPSQSYWIRATPNGGDAANSTSDTINVWHQLAGGGGATREWIWLETTNGEFNHTGDVKIEIATDSGGSNIVATGYYGGDSSVEIA